MDEVRLMQRRFVVLGCMVLALTLSAVVIWQDGAEWRVSEARRYPSSSDYRDLESAFCGDTHIRDGVKLGGKPDQPIITCAHERQSDRDLYVWGDSHARHLVPGLVETFPDHNIHILYFTSCPSQSGIGDFVYEYEGRTALRDACIDRNERAMAFFLDNDPAPIILHQFFGYDGQFSEEWFDSTRTIIATLTEHGNNLAFVGAVPRPDVHLAECLAVPGTIPDSILLRRCSGDETIQREMFRLNDDVAEKMPGNFINPNVVLCPTGGTCPTIEEDGLIYRDKHHLTPYGSRKLIAGIEAPLSEMLSIPRD